MENIEAKHDARWTWLLILLLLYAVSFAALAATYTKTISFTRPTTFVDGTTLPTTVITGYQMDCVSFDPLGSVPVGACAIPAQQLPGGTYQGGQVTLNNVPSEGGTACFTLKTMVGSNLSVASSPSACLDFPAVAPNPPTNVTIAVVIGANMTPVYQYNASNKREGDHVGSIALGKGCTGAIKFSYRNKNFRQVARADVKWFGPAITHTRLAAACALS